MAQTGFQRAATIVLRGSGGIGQHVARAFAGAGSDVALVYRSKKDVAEKIAGEIRALGRKPASIVPTSPTARRSTRRWRPQRARTVGCTPWCGPLARWWKQVFISENQPDSGKNPSTSKCTASFNAVQATAAEAARRGRGSYVHHGFRAGISGFPRGRLSVGAKSRERGAGQGHRQEEGRHNIRANTVLVGVIEAGMFWSCSSAACSTRNGLTKRRSCSRSSAGASPRKSAARRCSLPPTANVTGQQINVSGGFGI